MIIFPTSFIDKFLLKIKMRFKKLMIVTWRFGSVTARIGLSQRISYCLYIRSA